MVDDGGTETAIIKSTAQRRLGRSAEIIIWRTIKELSYKPVQDTVILVFSPVLAKLC